MTEPREEDLLMDHEYDGIKELDNKLPPWWLYLFYITIIWGVVYMIHYHLIGTGDSSYEEYMKEIDPEWTQKQKSAGFSLGYTSPFYSGDEELSPYRRSELAREREIENLRLAADAAATGVPAVSMEFDDLILAAMQAAKPQDLEKLKSSFPELGTRFDSELSAVAKTAAAPEPEPELPPMERLTDETSLAAGKEIYIKNCATCHGQLGEGGIGPNMADDYYIHGGSMASAVQVLNNGVAAKGMIAWRGILTEDQIAQVASYIMTLPGTNPPNAKAPQGEKYKAETETASAE